MLLYNFISVNQSRIMLELNVLPTFLLQTNSVNRMRHLKNLVEFMSEATKELIWMNQKEEPEVSRDWTRVDLGELQEYGEVWG